VVGSGYAASGSDGNNSRVDPCSPIGGRK